jgi:hypothetical protein
MSRSAVRWCCTVCVLHAEGTQNVELQDHPVNFCVSGHIFYETRTVLKNIWTNFLLEKYNSPDVAYGCETWSPSLTDEHRLPEFEKSVLRKIFVSETEGGIAGLNNLLHKDLHTCYAPSNILVIKSRKKS